MQYQLVFTKGPDQGLVVNLEPGQQVVLGRGDDCTVAIRDPHVSRNHCRIEVGEDGISLVDTDSSYGTTLNGARITQCVLKSGDLIGLGDTCVRLTEAVGSASSTVLPTGGEPTETRLQEHALSGEKRLQKLVGTKLVRYEVGEAVAKGRTGMIFRATDTKNDRPIALKVLWPELSQQQTEVDRFIRAIKTMLPIRHENLVRLYGAGASDGYCWMAMEFVEGESLADVITRLGVGGMLEWQPAFRAAVHVLRGLEVAFDHKIVHRNITPRNILIRSSDRLAKLGDLMLAKAMEGTLAETITRPGELVGELPYMSPEQTVGDPAIDCRSDIYNLGATLYRLISGHPPSTGDNPAEIIRSIQNDVPRKPSELQLSTPPLFEDLVLKMLAKEPADRPQTPTRLLRELERIAQFQGITDL